MDIEISQIECFCHRCIDENNIMDPVCGIKMNQIRMIVCPKCGNKRCPKADWHGYACANSNSVGQVGVEENNPFNDEPIGWVIEHIDKSGAVLCKCPKTGRRARYRFLAQQDHNLVCNDTKEVRGK